MLISRSSFFREWTHSLVSCLVNWAQGKRFQPKCLLSYVVCLPASVHARLLHCTVGINPPADDSHSSRCRSPHKTLHYVFFFLRSCEIRVTLSQRSIFIFQTRSFNTNQSQLPQSLSAAERFHARVTGELRGPLGEAEVCVVVYAPLHKAAPSCGHGAISLTLSAWHLKAELL